MISACVISKLPGVLEAAASVATISAAFETSDIPEDAPEAPNQFIPQKCLLRLLDQSARISGESDLGLLLGPHLDIADWGEWGGYLLAAPTLLGAMQRGVRAIKYHASHDRLCTSPSSDEVAFRYICSVRGIIGYPHYSISTAWTMINLIRSYLGPDWRPRRVELDLTRPKSSRAHEDVFQCPVIFEKSDIAVIIDREELATASTRRTTTRSLVTFSDLRRLVETGAPGDLITSVNELVRLRLLDGEVDIDKIAGFLELGPRTLQRRLNDEGTTFRALVSQVRAKRAIEMLRETEAPMIDIAVELGYSSSSHFTRAFSKTVGLVPSEIRRSADATANANRRA